MWFLTWLFMSVANASPAGPALGGITLGSSLPSGFMRAEINGVPTANTWIKIGTVGGMEGKFQVETCRGIVQDICFYPLVTTGVEHQLWSYTLRDAGFTSIVPYNWCTEKEGYMCQTIWRNQTKNRLIIMSWTDDGTPSLSETYDKPCTQGI
jgi:hypothetical protein